MVVIPVLCAGLSGQYLLDRYEAGTLSFYMMAVDMNCAIAVTAFAAGVLSAIGAIYNLVLDFSLRRLNKENMAFTKRENYMKRKTINLEARVELLSAMREVSHIMNTAMAYEETLAEMVRILEGLVEASELAVFLMDEEKGTIMPRVCKTDGKMYYGKEINASMIDDQHVIECVEHRSVFRAMDGQGLDLAVPLIAGQQMVGVLKMYLPLSGDAEEKERRLTYIDSILPELAKHVALTVRALTLHTIAVIDALTGLGTRRHFQTQLKASISISRRRKTTVSLIMIDIDHFKSVNDTYGHLTGDYILVGVADCLRAGLRNYDSAYRYGGEEMIIILPDTGIEEAHIIAERLREEIQDRVFIGEKQEEIHVTASMGVAEWNEMIKNEEDLISIADKALYTSKENGRNQVTVWPTKEVHAMVKGSSLLAVAEHA